MSLALGEVHRLLVCACLDGDIDIFLKLLYYHSQEVKSLITSPDSIIVSESQTLEGFRPGEYVNAACFRQRVELLAQLKKQDADFNCTSSYGTPLQIACQGGNVDVVKTLQSCGVSLESGHDVELQETGFYICCRYGNATLLEYLLCVVPSFVSQFRNGVTHGCSLLSVACRHGHSDVVRILVEKGVDINALVPSYETGAICSPLSSALEGGSRSCYDYLLEQCPEIQTDVVDRFHAILKGYVTRFVRQALSVSNNLILHSNTHSAPSSSDLGMVLDEKKLFAVHPSWFTGHSQALCTLNLHHNKLLFLPDDFFVELPLLQELDVSDNLLKALPSKGLQESGLHYLMASSNDLVSLPIELFYNPCIVKIDASKNSLACVHKSKDDCDMTEELLLSHYWTCSSMTSLLLDYNEIESIPHGIQGAVSLTKLQLGHNKLLQFSSMWCCPLEDLDLGHNSLSVFELEVELYWAKTLSKLILAHNKLKSISWHICQLDGLTVLDVSDNIIEELPMPDVWKCKNLGRLNLANNMLSASCGPDGFTGLVKKSLETAMVMNVEPLLLSNCEFPTDVFKETLQILNLSGNKLEKVPESMCELENLCELDLGNNPGIQALPATLGNLRNLWSLGLDKLDLPGIPADIRGKSQIRFLLAYLKAKLRKSVPFNRMKLMMAGLQERGKTSLLANLQGKKLPPDLSTVGIAVDNWALSPTEVFGSTKFTFWRGGSGEQKQDIIFNTWDLAGQNVYYATHQCFLTSNTLYLVVWNASHGHEGLDTLEPWLLNIQARAPKSKVITVGTFIDKIPSASRKTMLDTLEMTLLSKYDRKGFPVISGTIFISNRTGDGLTKLREVIYKVASRMYDSNLEEPMIGKKVPLSYVQLYDSIVKEAARRREDNKTPILMAEELLEIAKKNPDNDIFDQDELSYAARFLHDSGVIVHFNDQLRGLNNLYFIDPTWLCDMLALVVTVRERNPFVVAGYINYKDLMIVLKDPRLPPQFIPQYLQLLERFEIALTLDTEKILIPSMLPREKPVILLQLGNDDDLINTERSLENGICRNYNMSYVPTGFWNRLVARIIIAVHKWGVIVSSLETGDPSTLSEQTVTSKGVTKTKAYSMVYWRKGIFVQYNAGKFLIESFSESHMLQVNSPQASGIAITVWSDQGDFSVMGFVVDQVDMLIMEWYPGLEDVNEYGDPLVVKKISCPVCICRYAADCASSMPAPTLSCDAAIYRDETKIYQFDFRVCAVAAVAHKKIVCPFHPSDPVDLVLLIPDLLLTDLPSTLIIKPEEFVFQPSHKTRLGEGGAGGVYRGQLKGLNVAVKRFHSTQSGRFTDPCKELSSKNGCSEISDVFQPDNDLMLEQQVEDGKVIQAFLDMRQEVSVLCRLRHPCIIGFLGVSRIPLCFTLELAPLGCLQPVLEGAALKRRLQCANDEFSVRSVHGTVLSRNLTYKIALQVAHALSYLHDCDIIYRDLKSDNILLWSLSEDDLINVKLSDYGISCFAMPQGVVGEGGTPGFQAPEVRFGLAYDEKVDIFSFGIWLFELMTGQRPLKEHRTSAELRKAVYRGCRPSLEKAEVEPRMPPLEALMKDCWQGNPISRPSSAEIVAQMELSSHVLVTSYLPKLDQPRMKNVTCVLPLGPMRNEDRPGHLWARSLMQYRLLVWCGIKESRRCFIVDAESGIVQTELDIPGQRVLCAARVNGSVWLGTEGLQIEIFGRHVNSSPDILWTIPTKDAVTFILAEKATDGSDVDCRVFCALANGTVMVVSWTPCDNPSCDAPTPDKQENWTDPIIINLTTGSLPAKYMVFTGNNEELWVASGNYIVIVNRESLLVVCRLTVFLSQRSLIAALATDQRHVWSIDKKSSIIYQWCVESRQRVYSFDCNVTNPLGLLLGQVFEETSVGAVLSNECDQPEAQNLSTWRSSQPTDAEVRPNQVLGVRPSNLLALSPLLLKLRKKQPSLMTQRRLATRRPRDSPRQSRHINALEDDLSLAAQSRPRTAALSFTRHRPTSLLVVDNTLWVGRASGDVLCINITCPVTTTESGVAAASHSFGEVLTQLYHDGPDHGEFKKETTDVMRIPGNRIASVLRVSAKKMRQRLSTRLSDGSDVRRGIGDDEDVFEIMTSKAFNCQDFAKFKNNISSLRDLEERF